MNSALRSGLLAMSVCLSACSVMAGLLVKEGDKVAFLGDSITQFGSVKAGYVKLVMKGLWHEGVKAVMLPAGVSGERATNMLNRVGHVLSQKPQLMLLSCGVNDVWQDKHGKRLEWSEACVRDILDKAAKRNVKVVVMTATPINYPDDKTRDATMALFNEFLKEEAKARGRRSCRRTALGRQMPSAIEKVASQTAVAPSRKSMVFRNQLSSCEVIMLYLSQKLR